MAVYGRGAQALPGGRERLEAGRICLLPALAVAPAAVVLQVMARAVSGKYGEIRNRFGQLSTRDGPGR